MKRTLLLSSNHRPASCGHGAPLRSTARGQAMSSHTRRNRQAQTRRPNPSPSRTVCFIAGRMRERVGLHAGHGPCRTLSEIPDHGRKERCRRKEGSIQKQLDPGEGACALERNPPSSSVARDLILADPRQFIHKHADRSNRHSRVLIAVYTSNS